MLRRISIICFTLCLPFFLIGCNKSQKDDNEYNASYATPVEAFMAGETISCKNNNNEDLNVSKALGYGIFTPNGPNVIFAKNGLLDPQIIDSLTCNFK